MEHNIIYLTTNIVNNKFYLGVHATNDLDDGYVGSGLNLQRAIKKYGIENFRTEIIIKCDSRDDALAIEELLLSEDLLKSYDCYNLAAGGQGGYLGEQALEKSKTANTGKIFSKETRDKMSRAKKGKFRGEACSQFKGYWITPKGRYASSRLAAEAHGTTHMTVQRRCNNADLKDWYFETKD